MLDAYLDGLLSEPDRRTFESRLSGDSLLAGEVACQRRINATLSSLFNAPALGRVSARIASRTLAVRKTARAAPPLGRIGRSVAIAAVIGLAAFSALQIWREFAPRPAFDPYKPQPWRSFERVYHDTVAAGFNPRWVCKDDREFANTFRKRLGQSLALIPPPPGIAWAGVDYCNSITPSTTLVLARVYGEEVIVLVDRAKRDKLQVLPPGSDLNLFRREVGDLVLYECSTFDRPFLLDLFYQPGLTAP